METDSTPAACFLFPLEVAASFPICPAQRPEAVYLGSLPSGACSGLCHSRGNKSIFETANEKAL